MGGAYPLLTLAVVRVVPKEPGPRSTPAAPDERPARRRATVPRPHRG